MKANQGPVDFPSRGRGGKRIHYRAPVVGPLMGGPQCHLSILRNVPVDFKILQCHPSVLRNGNVPCRYF